MIISPKYKFVSFSTMKTGSTSVNAQLSKISDPNIQIYEYDKNSPKLPHDYNKNYFKHTSCVELHDSKLDNYFKFAFVRNPWDRVLSWFFFYKENDVGEKLSTKNETFDDFILNESKNNRWAGDNQSQSNFTKCCDFIGRFENLQQDFNIICDKIGIPQKELPHKNATKHKHYTEYYDDETKRIVAERFAKDIEHFNYKFG